MKKRKNPKQSQAGALLCVAGLLLEGRFALI